MFTYCENNPVIYADLNGESLIVTCILLGALIGATVGACIGASISQRRTGRVSAKSVAIGTVAGVVVGGVAGYGLGITISAAFGLTTAGSVAGTALSNKENVYSSVSSFINNSGGDADAVLQSYIGIPQLKTLEIDTTVYRVWGGKSPELSHWVSPFNYGDETRNLLSLPPSNTMENLSEFMLKKGTTVVSGEAAPLFEMSGGGIQWWVPKL